MSKPRRVPAGSVPEPWAPERRLAPRGWKSMDEARAEWERRCALTSSAEATAELLPAELQALSWRKLAWAVLDAVEGEDFTRAANEVARCGRERLGLEPAAPRWV